MNPNPTPNFDFIFIIVPIFIGVVFVIMLIFILSPKIRGKMMGRQVKSMKYMLDDVKDDLQDMGATAISMKKGILDQNEEALNYIVKKEAKIRAQGIESAARAVKTGLTEDAPTFCKHCGGKIPADAVFCSKCGKKMQ